MTQSADAKSRQKVLLLIPNLGPGGAQHVFHQHRRFLAPHYDLCCCVFNFEGALEHERDPGMLSLDVPAGSNFFSKITCFLKRVRRLKEIKLKMGIDITISHLEGADYVNVLSRQKDKVLLWIHGSKKHDREIKGFLGWLRLNLLLRVLYRRADRIVCVSEGIREELLEMGAANRENVVVVNNGVDIDAIHKLTHPLTGEWQRMLENNFVVITHCRFAPQKNLQSLIGIISKLKNNPRLKWVIAGDGEERERLLELCNRQGITSYRSWEHPPWSGDHTIYFIGRQQNPFPYLAAAQLYILTSLWEGFPLSLCEAIACGLPIISSDCPTGPREILGPELKGPVSSPTQASFGVLMPLPEPGVEKSIHLWSDYIAKLVADEQLLASYRKGSDASVARYSIVRSERETLEQVRTLSA